MHHILIQNDLRSDRLLYRTCYENRIKRANNEGYGKKRAKQSNAGLDGILEKGRLLLDPVLWISPDTGGETPDGEQQLNYAKCSHWASFRTLGMVIQGDLKELLPQSIKVNPEIGQFHLCLPFKSLIAYL